MRDRNLLRGVLIFNLLSFFTSILAHAEQSTQGGVTVRQVWARETPQGSNVTVAYLTIEAKKGSSDTLLSASSSIAGKVEIHTHEEDNGILKMRHLEKLSIPGGQITFFEPRGLHLMLMDLKKPLKAGGRFPLTLVFEKAGSLQVEALIKSIPSEAPHPHTH